MTFPFLSCVTCSCNTAVKVLAATTCVDLWRIVAMQYLLKRHVLSACV